MAGARKIAVIGAGAWGTALAALAAGNGHEVVLWTRDPGAAARLNGERRHRALPGLILAPAITASAAPDTAAGAELALFATPAQSLGEVAALFAPHLRGPVAAVIAAKGIERGSGRLMHEVLAAVLPDAVPAVLSGPSFAGDVASGLPTAVTLACADAALGADIAAVFMRDTFRPYLSDDLIGAELGGAIKNVLAIAAGIVAGRRLGENARAALIARGLAEMTRLGEAMGAARETFAGLSGLGDLVLTAMNARSRNTALGMALGEGRALAECAGPGAPLAEGLHTAGVVAALAGARGIDMPICAAVAAVIDGRLGIDHAIASLLGRPLVSESRVPPQESSKSPGR